MGALSEQVTVSAEAPLLETSKADRGGLIDRERVHELPLNGRNPFMLAKFVGGVNFNGADHLAAAFRQRRDRQLERQRRPRVNQRIPARRRAQ